MDLYGIVGAGGFGREVIPIASQMLKNPSDKLVFVVENKHQEMINGYLLLTIEEFFAHPAKNKFFNIAIANYQIRKRLAELMLSKGATAFRINAPYTIEMDDNEIGAGAIFCAFTTVTSNTQIGDFFHANIYSYIAHDCKIGNYITFAPNVCCNGNVIIEDYVYAGTGVIIREGTKAKPIIIGKGAILGMGAVITKSVPPFTTVIGNPARPLARKEWVQTT